MTKEFGSVCNTAYALKMAFSTTDVSIARKWRPYGSNHDWPQPLLDKKIKSTQLIAGDIDELKYHFSSEVLTPTKRRAFKNWSLWSL